MERLIIKRFGPLRDVDIELKNINIFIGTTSSGKSTIAKLISIFKGGVLDGQSPDALQTFSKLLANYNIDFQIYPDTLIRYENDDLFYEIEGTEFRSNISKNNIRSLNPIYIPAERVFFATLSQSVFSLINSDVALPKWLIDFGAKFESARTNIKELSINFLDIQYQWKDGTDYIKVADQTTIKLSQASSGIQSIVPLLLVVKHQTNPNKKEDDIFVIEEPELNLYPSSQKDLIEFIIERVKLSEDKLIITTHSPYLLTSIDNLIQAGNVVKERPELKAEVNELVAESRWIDYENVACYYFSNGTSRSTLDEGLKSIGPSNIDDISDELSSTFEGLLTLRYS
ncbi:AAA family ATPase [Sphingobacterium hotanense]|uniref:AAA family ATPase n=1 Tax=Sphingobacterium hotanense TaxID=649196 RepID=UPI0021A324AF|nr:AAA family ATPase [Sphingobacterium hotanense]MCT1525045.1 AAA family ATPase [Sphingobacterium hotanense]